MADKTDCHTAMDNNLFSSRDRLSHFSHTGIFLCCLDSYFQVSITRKYPLLVHVDTKRYIYYETRKRDEKIVYGR